MKDVSLSFIEYFALKIFYFISHEKGLGRAQMLCYSPLHFADYLYDKEG